MGRSQKEREAEGVTRVIQLKSSLKEEGMEMKKSKKVFYEFILPFVISQTLIAGCCAGWVYLWINM